MPTLRERARKLRMQQCPEAWHLDTEPEHAPDAEDQADEDDHAGQVEDESERRVRSTRRRQDAPELSRVPMEDGTIGRVFTAPDGRAYRPSMFVTLTLPSYGRVTAEGAAVDPASYDYRRAALDKAHDRSNLGLGGHRVLVSRKWSGKTLTAHRADRASVVRVALEEAGIDPDELSISGTDGRWSWEVLPRSRVGVPAGGR